MIMTSDPNSSGPDRIPDPNSLKVVADALLAVLALEHLAIAEHGLRVAAWARKLGELCALSDLEMAELECAAMLHDIALKTLPGKFTKGFIDDRVVDERTLQHLNLGHGILARMPDFVRIAHAVRCHHERFDGQGVPDKLKGEAIPLAARIIAVADHFDLEFHGRYTDKSSELEKARKYLSEQKGKVLDPELTNRFLFIISTDEELNQHDASIVELPFSGLRSGMVLARDLRAIDGAVLLRAGTTLTQTVLDRAFTSSNLDWLLTTAYVQATSIRL